MSLGWKPLNVSTPLEIATHYTTVVFIISYNSPHYYDCLKNCIVVFYLWLKCKSYSMRYLWLLS